jgi:hypothetical protein
MIGMGIDDARVRLRGAWALLLGLALGCANDERDVGFEPAWQPSGTAPSPGPGEDGGGEDGSDDGSEGSSAGSENDAVDDANDDAADAADDANDTAPASDDGTTAAEGDTGSGDPVLDACLDVAINECETCACNLCLDPLYACQQDPGCVAMRDCAEQAGCAGTECAEPCGAVIEMYGGYFGESATLALELSECLEPACPVCF